MQKYLKNVHLDAHDFFILSTARGTTRGRPEVAWSSLCVQFTRCPFKKTQKMLRILLVTLIAADVTGPCLFFFFNLTDQKHPLEYEKVIHDFIDDTHLVESMK
jgi:hypothetical protein